MAAQVAMVVTRVFTANYRSVEKCTCATAKSDDLDGGLAEGACMPVCSQANLLLRAHTVQTTTEQECVHGSQV